MNLRFKANNGLPFATLLAVALTFTPTALLASDWQPSGSLVLTQQHADIALIRSETAMSADFLLQQSAAAAGGSGWLLHAEASSTPKAGGVSGYLVEANSDIGSTLDKDNQGRLQLSELFYRYSFAGGNSLSGGLVDVSGFFEQSRIASDETTQFLGASFTGNPSIEFPDYSLGLIYEQSFSAGPVFRAAIASSNGLADNPDRSYSQLLSVTEQDKGLFAISSISWRDEQWLFRLGAWLNSAAHTRLDQPSEAANTAVAATAENFGGYLLAGYKQAAHGVNIRLGVANPKVSQASRFASLSYQYEQQKWVLGAGLSRSFLSGDSLDPVLDDMTQLELYARYTVLPAFYLTTAFQQIRNSSLGMQPATRDQQIRIHALRLTYLFG